jgi:hypothetical protein
VVGRFVTKPDKYGMDFRFRLPRYFAHAPAGGALTESVNALN